MASHLQGPSCRSNRPDIPQSGIIREEDNNGCEDSNVTADLRPPSGFWYLCEHLQRYEHRLETLKLRFIFPKPQEFRFEPVDNWAVDMTFLEKLGSSFKMVELVIEQPKDDPDYGEFKGVKDLVPVLYRT
ncbi:hypothetical protein BDV96DRAFT_600823 [Lophiotrema nucula]|uniref:Uncharacterized protein n=1 Tax=Lophiotrema nucula TaxID=690887 RepID=A0A6A5Z6S1_9PLEO|nr:hypothetical protein BDV96DRAFT_600823 [Lophiotrema nucula]